MKEHSSSTRWIVFTLLLLTFACLLTEGHNKKKSIQRSYDYGYALKFDGTADFVSLPELTFGSPFSLEFLVRPRGNGGTVFEFSDSNGRNLVRVSVISSKLNLLVVNDKGNTASVTSDFSLDNNQWQFVIITVSSSRSVTFYVESDNGDTDDSTKTLPSGFAPWSGARTVNYIGKSRSTTTSSSTPRPFNGDLDEIRLWNRLLSDDEISNGRLRPLRGDEDGFVAFYDCNQGNGLVLTDITVNQFHGALGANDVSKAPSWIVSGFAPSSTCSVWSSFTKTFDKKTFSVPTTGIFWVTNTTHTTADSIPDVLAQVRVNARRKANVATVSPDGFAFQTSKDYVVFDFDLTSKSDTTVTWNGQLVTVPNFVGSTGISIVKTVTNSRTNAHYIEFLVPFTFSGKITVTPSSGETKVEVKLNESPFKNNNINGLCGDYDGTSSDDIGSPINLTWAVSGTTLFTGTYSFGDPISQFACDIQDYPSLYTVAKPICENTTWVSSDLQSNCYYDVCVAGDLSGAVRTAEETYKDCLENSSNTGGANLCNQPCPNFCSFNGQCINGQCTCNQPFIGKDCSQKGSYPCFAASWPGESEVILQPFTGTANVVSHYKYNSPRYSSANTKNEIQDTTVVYLYQQLGASSSASNTSLIVINDLPLDGSGGKAFVRVALTNAFGGPLTGVSVAVRDDTNDKYNTSALSTAGIVTANWTWSECCTDGFALTNLPLSTDFCASLTFSNLQSISQGVVSGRDINGDQEVTSFPLGQTIQVCGKNCTNSCVQHTSCDTCMADSNCGWCSDSQVCVPGSSEGPDQGKCRSWRYSYTSSRVLTAEPGFPVDPSSMEYFLNQTQGPFQATFSVRVPDNDDVPLEALVLQDISSAFASDLSLLRASIVQTYLRMVDIYPAAKLAVGAFSDKPVSPYGSPNLPDYTYNIRSGLTADPLQIQSALNTLAVASGGDEPNSQLEALLLAAKRIEVGWSDNARKVIILITKSSYHTPVNDPQFVANNGDGDFPNFGATENYPTVAQVRSALLAENIIPLFVTTPGLASVYQDLVNQFGFGYVSSYTELNSQSIFAETLESLDNLGGIIRPIVYQQGDIVGTVTPAQYSGISPQTRVTFQVTLSDTSSQDAIVVVPGFGSITLSHLATDNPVADSNSDMTVLTTDDVVFRLSGTSVYDDVVSTVVTQLPNGLVFQYNEGSRGSQLTGAGPWTVSDPSGRVLFNANGQTGTSTIRYYLKDSCQACSTFASFQVTTSITKALPQATPNSGTCNEDGQVSVNLNGTSSNPSSLVSRVTSLPSGGKISVNGVDITTVPFDVPSGVVTYKPNADQYGLESAAFLYDTFYFTVYDSEGQAIQSAPISLYVIPQPDAPITTNVTASGSEDQATTFTLVATDADGDTLSYIIDSITPSGFVCVGDPQVCSWSSAPFTSSTPSINFKAPANANGAFQLAYRALDSGTSTVSYVDITIAPINDLPVATAGSDTTNEDTQKQLTLNIIDIDNTAAQFGPVICAWNGPGTLTDSTGTPIPYTSTYYNLPLGSNVVNFTPASNGYGSAYATISFAGRDSVGTSPCVTFTINVTPVNDAPQSFPDVANILEATQASITLRGSDVDTTTLTFYLCSSASKGTLVNADNSAINNVITGVSGQTASVKYTPVGNENGANYAFFSFMTFDGQYNSSCSNITINVAGVQNAPSTTGTTPSPVTTAEDTSLLVTLTCSDPDGDSLTYRIENPLPSATNVVLGEVSTGQNVTASRAIVGNQIRILPFLNWNGVTSFTYSCTDGNNTATPSTVTVTVTSVNDRPVAISQTAVTAENQNLVILLSGSDIETPAGSLAYQIQSPISRGTLLVCSDQACSTTTGPAASGASVTSGAVKFIPDPYTNDNNTGVYTTFTFLVVDGSSETSVSPATVTISVTLVNYAPQATTPNSTVTAPYNQDILLYLSVSDPDDDTPLIVTVSSVGLIGRLFQYNNGGRGLQIQGSNVTVTDNQYRVIYTTQTGAKSSSSIDTISYVVSDPAGLTGSGQVNVTLPPNDPPVANAGSPYNINEDTTVTITLSGVDFDDANNTFTAFVSTLPGRGKLFQIDGVTPINTTDTQVADSGNRVVFVPDLNENGGSINNNFYATFSYYVVSQNTSQKSNPANLSINVAPVNDLPVLTMTGVSIPEKNYTVVTLSAYDPDGDAIRFVIRYVNGAVLSFFQVNPDGSKGPAMVYYDDSGNPTTGVGTNNISNPNALLGVTPVVSFSGTTLPQFRVCDFSGCGPITGIAFTVFTYPEAPIAQSGTFTFTQPLDGAGFGPVSFDVSDPDDIFTRNSILTVTLLTLPAKGRLYRSFTLDPSTEITSNRTIDLPNQFTQIFYTPESYTVSGDNYTSFQWIVTDETGLVSSVATNVINIRPPCSQPAVISAQGNGLINTTAGTQTTFNWHITDDDPYDIFFVIKTQPKNGRLWHRGYMQLDAATIYPNVNLDPDASNLFDLQVYPTDDTNTNWYLDYVPNPGYSSFGGAPDCFQYQYLTCGSFIWPEVFTGCVYVTDVNTAPSISLVQQSFTSTTSGVTITGVSVSDDSLTFPIIVTLTGTNAQTVSLVSTSGVTYTQNTAVQATIQGTVSAINTALASGIQFVPTATGTLIIQVNDQGYYSEVAQGAGPALTTNATVTVTLSAANSLSSGPAAVTGAFVGSTGIVSAAVYGVYRTLKSKKVIPEEADPWENDDAFDATGENPLYGNGVTPIYSSSL